MSYKEYTVRVSDDGQTCWYIDGKLHREDGPAIESADGKCWYINDELHREDGPAVEYANGTKHWYINGEHHREDGPAVEHDNGNMEWFLYGEKLLRTEFNNRKDFCHNKIIEIDGKKYKLISEK